MEIRHTGQAAVPLEASITVHRRHTNRDDGVLGRGGNVEQRAHEVVALHMNWNRAQRIQRRGQHGHDDLYSVWKEEQPSSGSFIQVAGDVGAELISR